MRMILLTALILVGLGTTLYQVKTGIDERQEHLQRLELSITKTKRDIAILQTEWAYRTRPERIITLSDQLLDLKPIAQDRILPIEAIPIRLSVGAAALRPLHKGTPDPKKNSMVSQ